MTNHNSFLSALGLLIPKNNSLPESDRHFLLYIPWDDKYLSSIPSEFKSKFRDCLPYLGVRTTDVHVAICFRYFNRLVADYEQSTSTKIDREVVGLSLILHDIGWSQLSESEVAASLGVTGLKLTETAVAPKEKHAIAGEKIARDFLDKWGIDQARKEIICKCVRWHDKPEAISDNGVFPAEVQLLTDLDHLWSFTPENFWQDTQRKDLPAEDYLQNLSRDLDAYFVTDVGKNLARQLLADRKNEVGTV